MIEKLLVAVVAAGALSVPLAGVAWAEPPDDPGSPNGNGIGAGGLPGAPVEGEKIPPGSQISSDGSSELSPKIAKAPGSVPDVISDLNNLPRVGPGQYVKRWTPGCGNGVATNPTNSCE